MTLLLSQFASTNTQPPQLLRNSSKLFATVSYTMAAKYVDGFYLEMG